jgi:hypothetical protein
VSEPNQSQPENKKGSSVGFFARLTAWREHHGIPYRGVPVGTIKKHATGRGKADKAAMLAAMRVKGYPVTDDNEADARGRPDRAHSRVAACRCGTMRNARKKILFLAAHRRVCASLCSNFGTETDSTTI